MENYYTILGVDRTADLLTIKKGFRNLAFKFHPDKNTSFDGAQKFIQITEAYEVLRNEKSRTCYDALLFRLTDLGNTVDDSMYQEAWKNAGKRKAKAYGAIPIDVFLKRIFDEIKFGANYGGQFLLIAFCFFAVISSPTLFSIDPLFGFIYMACYSGIGYLLFKRTKKEYLDTRTKKFTN